MAWVNAITAFNTESIIPGGAVTGFAGDSMDSTTLSYSAPLPNQSTIIWQMCSVEAESRHGADRNSVGPYGQNLSGEGGLVNVMTYAASSPGMAINLERNGVFNDVFRRARYRLVPLINPCNVPYGQVEVGIVLGHTSFGGISVLTDGEPNTAWEWTEVDFRGREDEVGQYRFVIGLGMKVYNSEGAIESGWAMEWQVWVDETPVFVDPRSYVYEAEKGWTFDGNYIPHYAEVNWYFGENPVDYTGIQKVRVHGLTQGRALLTLATNGIAEQGYEDEYSEPQVLDLPRNPVAVYDELEPITNYVDTANRGLGIQMKFEGRNTDIARPEPGHVLQVLVVQASPPGSGARSN